MKTDTQHLSVGVRARGSNSMSTHVRHWGERGLLHLLALVLAFAFVLPGVLDHLQLSQASSQHLCLPAYMVASSALMAELPADLAAFSFRRLDAQLGDRCAVWRSGPDPICLRRGLRLCPLPFSRARLALYGLSQHADPAG